MASVCSFTSFSTFEWVQPSLAFCSHLSVLFLTSFLLFLLLIIPKVIDGRNREGMGVKPTSGKMELACEIVCELRRITQYTLSVIINSRMVLFGFITCVFMVASDLALVSLPTFPDA